MEKRVATILMATLWSVAGCRQQLPESVALPQSEGTAIEIESATEEEYSVPEPKFVVPNLNKYAAAEIRLQYMIYDLGYVECTGPHPETGLFKLTTQITRSDNRGPHFSVEGSTTSATMQFMPERTTAKNIAIDPTVFDHSDAVNFDGKIFYYTGTFSRTVNDKRDGEEALAITIDCPG